MRTFSPAAPAIIPGTDYRVVGRPVPRPDAPDKVTGKAKYIDDLGFVGMLHAAVVRSPHAHARVLRVNADAAKAIPGVLAVLTAKDIPGQNLIPMIQMDWVAIADEETRHVGEAVALIAAETKEAAEAAAQALTVLYEVLPAVLNMDEAFEKGEIITHWQIHKGDVREGFARSALVLEETYTTPYQEHAYLETNGVLAAPDGNGGIIVYGSLQCPFYLQKGVANVLGLPLNQVRIVQMPTGGGFGGKEDYPSLPGALCALLAWKTNRPVKLILSREEDMTASTKRHPGKIKYTMGVDGDGRIQAVEVDYFLDGGAYATLSPVVLWRGIVHAAGPYDVPNAKINAYALRTNTPPNGAFRGFGEPQVVFAAEAHVDRMAEALRVDPLEFRMRNLLDYGGETITGHRLETSMGLREVVARVTEAAEWKLKRLEYQSQTGPVRKGIGIAILYYGVGLGAQGKHLNPAGANMVVSGDGSVTVAVGTTEIGQGMITVLSQIAAEALECDLGLIKIVEPDTSRVPDSGPTVASRTTLMSGNAIRDAARQIKERIADALGAHHLPWVEAVKAAVQKQVHLSCQGWAVPPTTTFDLDTGQGQPYVTYTWCCNTVEVEVDTTTGEVRPLKVVSGHDVGKIINPQTGEGQIEGGVVQGLGYALVEEHLVKDGRILNNQFSTYIIPTPMDVPTIVPIIVEHPYPWGPYGAKGLGETPLIGVAPAVVNAVAHALGGVRLNEIPATPERVWAAWRNAHVDRH